VASGKGASDSQSGGPLFKSHSGAYWSFRFKVVSLQVFNYGKKKDLEEFHENINNINSKYEET